MANLPSNNDQQNFSANQTQNQLSPINNNNELIPSHPANSYQMLDNIIPPNPPATLLPSDMVNFDHQTQNGFLPNYHQQQPVPPEFNWELPYEIQSLLSADMYHPPILPNQSTVNIMQQVAPAPMAANVNEQTTGLHFQEPKNMGISLQVPNGVDLVNWLVEYARSHNVSIVVLGGNGMVSLVHLITHNIVNDNYIPVLNVLPEDMSIIDMSGTCILNNPLSQMQRGYFTATLCRMNNDLIGGRVTAMVTKSAVVLNVMCLNF